MAIWNGFAQVQPASYNLRQWADDRSSGWVNDDGSELKWWELAPEPGVTFRPSNCTGAHVHAVETCVPCTDCADDTTGDRAMCFDALADPVTFDPFWVYKAHSCDPVSNDPNEVYRRLRASLDVLGWIQVARQFHLELQDRSTDVTGAEASNLGEGLGTLYRNRGVLGLTGGALVVPNYLLPALATARLTTAVGGRLLGPNGEPVITDPGFPVTGPGGTAPGVGTAFIYLIDQPPVVAFRDEAEPGGTSWDWNNPRDRRKFWDDLDPTCENCFQPIVKRRGIVAFNPCAAFAINVRVEGS